MDGSFDLSKIISMVAENPELVAGFKSLISSSLANESNKSEDAAKTALIETEKEITEDNTETEATLSEAEPAIAGIKTDKLIRKRRRKELLCALKPYVCKERSKAIDTMLSITEVLDVLKES